MCGNVNLKMWIHAQERLQHVLLIPEEPIAVNPSLWVVVWKKYVVDVDNDARAEYRQDLENFIYNVTAIADDVGGIDEQYIITFQLLKSL